MNNLENIVANCERIHVYRMNSGMERLYQAPAEQMEEWKRWIAHLPVGQRVVIDTGRPPRSANE